MKTLDMRGNPCPIPVITAKKELNSPNENAVVVLVDDNVAVQNLQKMANGMKYNFSYVKQGEDFRVSISKNGDSAEAESKNCNSTIVTDNHIEDGITVLITTNQMGNGSEELGKILIKGFLFSLTELSVPPKVVIFLNNGVQLVVSGSNTTTDLQVLHEKGTKILACGTCLNYYSLTDKLAVGEITDMFGITERLASATKLITL